MDVHHFMMSGCVHFAIGKHMLIQTNPPMQKINKADPQHQAQTKNTMTSHKTHQCGRALCVALALAAFTNFGPAAVNGGIPSIVTESARKCQNPDPVTYLNAIERNAVAYCDSNAIAGRQEYMEELQKIMKRRKLHLTVGGTDVGKTKIMQSLIARVKEKDQDTILYVDMRSPGTMDVMKRLEEELLNRGPAVLQKIGRAVDAANLDGVLSPLKGPWRAILAVARFGIAAAPDVKLEKFFESMRNQGKVLNRDVSVSKMETSVF